MKKVFLALLSVFICLAFSGCGKLKLKPVQFEKISAKSGFITVEATPKYELMSILCHVAGYEDASAENELTKYVDIWFDEYRTHKAVKLMTEYHAKYGMNLDTAFSLLLCVADDLSCYTENLKEKPYFVDESWFSIDTDKFLKAFNSFAEETKFSKFYLLYQDYYKKAVLSITNVLDRGSVCAWLEDFYFRGQSQDVIIHTSESLCGNNLWYSAAKQDGTTYVNCIPPIYEKQNEYHLAYRIAQNFINSKIDLIWSLNGDFLSGMIDNIKQMRGEEPANLSQKYSFVIADLLQFDLCDFVRRFNSEEIYQIYVESLKQIASEELLAKFEDIVNDYVLNKDKYPTYQSFVQAETNWLFELYASMTWGSAFK